jgi:3D (Asp-Asp-Asp) domain-containing protein
MSFSYVEEDIEKGIQNKKIDISLNSGKYNSCFTIDLQQFINNNKAIIIEEKNVSFEIGPKIIYIKYNDEILEFFTIEKLLFDRSHNYNIISGIDDYRNFNKYHLHYIGISKEDDALTRLVINPHDKRLRILSNECSCSPNARLTDEITLFFFKLTTLEMITLEDNNVDDFIENFNKETGTKIEKIADVEKAFIKVLNPEKYNIVKYKSYPKSSDGLYKHKIDRYSYFIGESYTFYTEDNEIVGNYTENDIDIENKSDFIAVDPTEVIIFDASGNVKIPSNKNL